MKAFISIHRDGGIGVIATLEDPSTGWAGDWRKDLAPGQGIGQYTYDQLRAHGSGFIDIDLAA